MLCIADESFLIVAAVVSRTGKQSHLLTLRFFQNLQKMSTADEFKTLGNQAFSAKNYEEAIGHFSKAIELAPTNHVLFSNRY